MKLLILTWRDPNGNLQSERFDGDKFLVSTDPGWLRLREEGEIRPLRIIPSDKVCLVQYVEEKEEPRIVPPILAMPNLGKRDN